MTEYFRASRHLDLDGAYNTRDIGGYETLDGRMTRPRTLFPVRQPPQPHAGLPVRAGVGGACARWSTCG